MGWRLLPLQAGGKDFKTQQQLLLKLDLFNAFVMLQELVKIPLIRISIGGDLVLKSATYQLKAFKWAILLVSRGINRVTQSYNQ